MELVYEKSYLKFQRASFFCVVSPLFQCTLSNTQPNLWFRGGEKMCWVPCAITNTPRFSLPRLSMNEPLKSHVLRVWTWEIAGRGVWTVRVSRRAFIVTERRENGFSACVGLFAVTASLIFAVITERLERVFVGRSFLLTQLCR